MKQVDNIGEIASLDLKGPWRHSPEDGPLDGNEFEAATVELESFFEGLSHAFAGAEFVVVGDFHGERTHHVCVTFAERDDGDEVCRILQKWLSTPRRSNWRIIVDFEIEEEMKGRCLVYGGKIFRLP